MPSEIRDNDGNMISRYTYSADGVKRAVVDSNGNGKYYVGSFARFQRTDGSFNAIDPLAEKYYSMSPYAYCAGNPINTVDIDGRAIETISDVISLCRGNAYFLQ